VPSREPGPAAETSGEGDAIVEEKSQEAISQLVAHAVAVLRAHARNGSTGVELSPGVAAKPNGERAHRAAPALRALRSVLQDYVDGTERVPPTADSARRATEALRDLLELVLEAAVPLPGENGRKKPGNANGLDEAVQKALAAAAALEFAGETEPDGSDRKWTVRNLTARRLRLRRWDGIVWVLSPHGSRRVDRNQLAELDLRREWAREDIEVTRDRPPPRVNYAPLSLWLLLVPAAYVLGSLEGTWGWIVGAVAVALPPLWVAVATSRSSKSLKDLREDILGWARQAFAFLIVLLFCLAVPAATLYYGANLEPVVSGIVDGNATRFDYLTVVCRTMQLVLIAVVALLPALLFYQFDRDRLTTLRERFEHQIFRLDPEVKTVRDIDAKYGQQMDEIYGIERPGRSSRLQPGRVAPIFVATVLIMLGWLLVLLNPDVEIVTSEEQIAELFDPRQTAPAFAFLGAYFFTLFALLRGYVRRDLRPKSYSDISVRIVTVVILAWVLELGFQDDSTGLLVFAFVAGIVPQAALNWLREQSQAITYSRRSRPNDGQTKEGKDSENGQRPGGPDTAVAAALDDPLPLTDLEGIDLYDRTRLASEGVTNIEALAHHDLVELMLMTRIPVPRLIDWTDQAILYLHVNSSVDRAVLRGYGIRTASDLLHASDTAKNRDKFLAILGGEPGKPKRLDVLVEAMNDEAWMKNIRFWHGERDGGAGGANGSPGDSGSG
jgi:hypothetical protein